MALQIRVKLVNGDTHRITLQEGDPEEVLKKLRMSAAPFSGEWLESTDGEMIRVSAIASLFVEPRAGDNPLIGDEREGEFG